MQYRLGKNQNNFCVDAGILYTFFSIAFRHFTRMKN